MAVKKEDLAALDDAPTAQDHLAQLEDAQPSTPTGLAPLDKPSGLMNDAVNAIPGIGPAKQVLEKVYSTPKGAKAAKFGVQGAAMAAGGMAADVPAIASAAAGAPEAVLPALAVSATGAGLGNVVGGLVTDLHDDPQGAMDALKVLFDPTVGGNFAQLLQTDPERAMAVARDKLGKRFAEGAIGQILSLGLQSLVPSTGGILDIGSKAIPGVEQSLRDAGYTPDAAQFTKSRIAQVAKSVANTGMLSAETMAAQTAKNAKVAATNLGDLTTNLAGNLKDTFAPSEIADIITSGKEGLAEPLQRELENAMYGKLDSMVASKTQPDLLGKLPAGGGVPVPLQPVKDAAAGLNFVDKTGQIGSITRGVNAAERYVSFETAQGIRSSLNDVIRNSTDAKEIRAATTLMQSMDGSMADAAKNAGPDIYSAWRDANAFTKTGKETFNNDLVSKLFVQDSGQAEKVGRSLMSNGNTSQIASLNKVFDRIDYLSTSDPVAFQKVLGNADPETRALVLRSQKEGVSVGTFLKNRLKAGTLQDLLSPYTKLAPDSETGYAINYAGLSQELDPKTNPEGYEKLRTLFGGDGVSKLQTTVTTAARATQANAQAFDRAIYWGERIVGGMTGGAVGELAGHPFAGAMLGEGLGMFGIPKLASYLLTDPVASKYFTNGVKMLAESGTTSAIRGGMDMIVKAATVYADTYKANKGVVPSGS